MYSGQLGWLRGNEPDEGIDQLLVEFGQSVQMTVLIGRWFEIRQRVRQVSAEQFIEQGLSGQALGDAIDVERLSILFDRNLMRQAPLLAVKPARHFGYSVIPQNDFQKIGQAFFDQVTVFSGGTVWISWHNAP